MDCDHIENFYFFFKDDPLFKYINDDGLKVEPEWYCPIIPTVLVNGAEGIGTGWSTKIPNYNPREIIDNIKRLINGKEPVPMEPFYKNFRGKIEQLDDVRVITHGKISIIEDNTIEITGKSNDGCPIKNEDRLKIEKNVNVNVNVNIT